MKLNIEHINQRYLLNTRRFATLAACLVLTSGLLILFVIVPQIQSVIQLVDDLQEANKDVASLRQKVDQLGDLHQSDLIVSQDAINSVLPSRKPLLELLTSYSQIAQETGVQFSDVSLSPGRIATQAATAAPSADSGQSGARRAAPTRRRTADYDQLDLNMKVSGTLSNINQFLQRVEQIAPVTTVTNMSLTEKLVRSEEAQPADFFEADLTTTSYFFTQPVSATVRAPLPTVTAEQQAVISQINTFFIPQVDEQTVITGGGLQDLFGLSDEDLL
jgi:Tfp pilus assembly protein PilO